MTTTSLGRLLLLGVATAAAVALAPTAGAAPGPGCSRGASCSDASPEYEAPESSFTDNIPKGWTNEAQFVRPGYNPFGAGPQPPLLALE